MNTSTRRFATIDEYISTFPGTVQSILAKIRQTIGESAPEAVEAISYQMPTFKLRGRDLVHFAAFRYKHGNGSIRFPLDEPIPYGLVKKAVTYRAKEISGG